MSDPTPQELTDYYSEHRGRYQISERRSFSHLYFSPDRDGDGEARARAVAAAQTLRHTRTPRDSARGDAFAGRSDYASLTAVETTRAFGESEFSHAVFVAPVGEWSGPYRSGFGWHLIYVRLVEPARIPPLSEVLEAVRADCIEAIRQRKNAEAFATIRDKYTVVLPNGIARPVSPRATLSATGSAGAD